MKQTYRPFKLIAGLALAISFFSTDAFAQIGTNDSTFNTPDNNPSSWYKSANSWVRVSAAQADNNKLVIGGEFTAYNGEAHSHIVRLFANGSIDPSFNSGTGLNGTPTSVAIQADNKILVGGNFSTYNGTAVGGFIRINEDGSLDNAFAAAALGPVIKIKVQSSGKFFVIAGSGLTRINADGTIDGTFTNTGNYGGRDYAVQSDGKIIIASDETDSLHLIRVFANGTLDPSYKSDLAVRSSVVGASWPEIHSIGIQPDGKVIIGGYYQVANSQEIGILRRVNTDGTPDTTYTLDVNPNDIYTVNIQPDGKAIVSGHWSRNPAGREHTYVQYIARLNDDGSTDDSFVHNNKYIRKAFVAYTSTLLNNGKVLVGGFFEQLNAYSVNNVALLNSDGTMDGNFNAIAGVNGTIRTSAIQADQKILIGGLFSNVQFRSRSHIARLLADGGVDTTFNPGKGTNGPVYAIVSQTDGKAIVGGEFTSFDTDSVKNIVRLNSDGSIDLSFQTTISGIVYSLELQSDNKIIVGGYFSQVNGEARFDVVRLNTDGSIDNTFAHVFPLSETNGDQVNTSLIAPNGQIYIGGDFTVGSKYSLARLNADGTVDETFTQNYSTIYDIARQPDGKILAVGGAIDYWSESANGFALRLNTDGSKDTTWTETSGPDIDPLHSVLVLSTGGVLVGGEFMWSWLPNSPPSYLTLFDSTGNVDSTFVGVIDGPVYTTQGVANDKVIVGGSFHTYTGAVRNNIARIYAPNYIPTAIKNHTANPTFILYPNPATSFINAANLKQGSIITIYNITGAVIHTEQVTDNNALINISTYANGIYFITQQNKSEISTQRFVVNN